MSLKCNRNSNAYQWYLPILSSCCYSSQEIWDVEDHLGMKEYCHLNCFPSTQELLNWKAIQIHDSLINKLRMFNYMCSLRITNIDFIKLSNDDNKPKGHKFKLLTDKSRISKDRNFDKSSNIYTYMIRDPYVFWKQ